MHLFILLVLIFFTEEGDSVCRLQGLAHPPELAEDGDLVIGGIFSFRTGQDYVTNTFQTVPEGRKCNKYVLLYICLCFVNIKMYLIQSFTTSALIFENSNLLKQ